MRWRRRLQLAAVVIFLVAYAGLSHYGNSVAKTHDFAVGLAFGPVLAFGLLLLLRWTHLCVSVLGLCASWCTEVGDSVHGSLTREEVRYARRVTAAWAVFFILITGATFGLFLFAPLRIWSLFANFCVLPLIGLMFVAEYAVRRRALPQVPRRGILAAVRVYFAKHPNLPSP